MKKYLVFARRLDKKGKTKVFTILNKITSEDIGTIKWNGAWRQYCFYPDSNTHWAKGCLIEVAKFIEKLMDEWSAGLALSRGNRKVSK